MNWHDTGREVPAPCRRCTGLGDAHYLTCPTLQVRRRQRCVYCGRWSYRPGWGCGNCGLITWEDVKAAAMPP